MSDNNGELILYRSEDGRTDIHLRAADGTVWLSQAGLAELFQTTPQNITQHIRMVYEEGEATEEATCKDYFKELLRRIRDIRSSEKRFYQTLRDLFKASSSDYDGTAQTAEFFFHPFPDPDTPHHA